MDDPISALDANVRKKILENLVLGYLKRKTRVLVTHAIDFIHLADKIIILQKGAVAAQGTFEELKENELLVRQMKVNQINTEQAAAVQKEEESEGVEAEMVEQSEGGHSSVVKKALINTMDSRETLTMLSQPVEEKVKIFEQLGRVTAANDGKIIKDENEEVINVEMSSYRLLLKFAKGHGYLVLLNLVMLGFTFCKIKTDYTIGLWAKDASVQSSKYVSFTIAVFAYASSAALCMFFQSLIVFLMGINASKSVHQQMISTVLKAPVNLFYDVTPAGTILNRFSKDLQVLDNTLCNVVAFIVILLYQLLSVLIVISVTNFYIIILLPFMCGLAYALFSYSLPAYREGTRIESITKSTLLNNINETVAGSSTIRAFNREEAFIKHHFAVLDKNILANQIIMGNWCWYGIRMDLVAILLMAGSSAICFAFRESEDPVLVAMTLSYIIQLQGFLLELLYQLGDLERQMVSIQRCFELLKIP